MEKKYYINLDILRILLCISILLYHLNIIKGGYLAVCCFFVLSGYLAVKTSFRDEKFNIFKYYYKRIKKIYLPLIITVFLTILITSLFKNINWINLKPETNSVLLNYNNFWQLNANLDYFTPNVLSTFTHLWYISILIQFEILFPFIFIILKFIGKHINRILPILICMLLAITSYYYFINITNNNIMTGYFNTFSRLYALFIGMTIGFYHYYYKQIIMPYFQKKWLINIYYSFYIIILLSLFILIKVTNNNYSFYMLLVCLITWRIIDYSVVITNNKIKLINTLANCSYEIYLVQYPLIFLFSFLNYSIYLKNTCIFIISFIIALIMHFTLDLKNNHFKYLRYCCFIIITIFTIYGGYIYTKAIDHTQEFKDLEKALAANEKLMEEKQKEYSQKIQEQEDNWNNILADLDNEEEQIKEMVLNLPLIGIGDSVMLGAIDELYQKFPNSYINAKVSRTDYEANDILINLKNNNMLGYPIIFNLGTNGQCGNRCRLKILETCGDKKIYWINVTNDNEVHVNNDLKQFADNYDNVSIIDWNSISAGHPEYFIADGIHLTPVGRQAYVETIYNTIYSDYIKEFNNKKEEILANIEKERKEKITFYGNTLLLNAYNDIEPYFEEANYLINESFDYSLLNNELDKAINNKTLTYNIMFVFDDSFKLNNKQLNELIEKLNDYNIYFILLNNDINIEKDNIHIIDFKKEIDNHSDYLMVDKIHLSNKGNKALANIIKEHLNTK